MHLDFSVATRTPHTRLLRAFNVLKLTSFLIHSFISDEQINWLSSSVRCFQNCAVTGSCHTFETEHLIESVPTKCGETKHKKLLFFIKKKAVRPVLFLKKKNLINLVLRPETPTLERFSSISELTEYSTIIYGVAILGEDRSVCANNKSCLWLICYSDSF